MSYQEKVDVVVVPFVLWVVHTESRINMTV